MSDQERISCHHSITTSGRCDENKEKYQLKDYQLIHNKILQTIIIKLYSRHLKIDWPTFSPNNITLESNNLVRSPFSQIILFYVLTL